jgi:hypothetical protein
VFKGVLSRTSLLCDKEVLPCVPAGTLEDALVFYEGKARIYAVLRTTVLYCLRGVQRHPNRAEQRSRRHVSTGLLVFACCMSPAADLPLWLQTDGVVEWVQEFMQARRLRPPSLDSPQAATGLLPEADAAPALGAAANEGIQLSGADLHDMYKDMFSTAFEIIAEAC